MVSVVSWTGFDHVLFTPVLIADESYEERPSLFGGKTQTLQNQTHVAGKGGRNWKTKKGKYIYKLLIQVNSNTQIQWKVKPICKP